MCINSCIIHITSAVCYDVLEHRLRIFEWCIYLLDFVKVTALGRSACDVVWSATLGVNLVWNVGVVDMGSKIIYIFSRQISEKCRFLLAMSPKKFDFRGKHFWRPGPPRIPNSLDSRDPKFPLGIPGNFWISVTFRREFTGIWLNCKF